MPDRETIRRRNPPKTSSIRNDNDLNSGDIKSGNRSTLRVFIKTVILCLVAGLIYAYATSPISAKIIEPVKDSKELTWAHVHNEDLKNGVRILEELHGPESVAADNENGYWYTGTHDGKLIRIENVDQPTPTYIDITSKLVNGPYSAGKGSGLRRPLALRLRNGKLFLADAYQGIFVVDTDTYTWEKIVGYDGVHPELKFADDLTVNKAGTKVYFTDMSVKWDYNAIGYMRTEGDCSGRVIEADVKTKATRVIKRDLCSPNGIELTPDEAMLAVCESPNNQILLLDRKSGEVIRKVHMPGNVDNIRRSKDGGYWVALPTPTIRMLQWTRNVPFIRDILARILGTNGVFIFADLSHGGVVKLNKDFEPVSIHKDTGGELCRVVTEIVELNNGFLICSFMLPGLVKIDKLVSL